MSSAPVRHDLSALPEPGSVDNLNDNAVLLQGVLNTESIRRLRELDPTGESLLLTRLFHAFETSLNRLLPQLERARDTSDAAGVRLIAHTLKSSSATIGAVQLSKVCADVEALARESRLDVATSGIDLILSEAQAVRQALRRLTAADAPAGAA